MEQEFLWKVLRSNVLIKPNETKKETESGVAIPDTAQEIEPEGVIVSVGPGYPEKGEPNQSKVGDYVKYMINGAIEVNLEGINYLMMDERNIIVWR